MERHPAGCDPSSFRSLPTPSRAPPPPTNTPPNRPSLPPRTTNRPSQFQDMLNVPGIESALCTLQAVASDVVQPVTRYNRFTYLNRFNTAALRLADAFIDHVNQVRRHEIQLHRRNAATPSDTPLRSTYVKHTSSSADEDSEDLDLVSRKRSIRLARKRPRSIRYVSSEEDDYFPVTHRKTLPRRSKELRPNLNEDLAYTLMARRPPSPERPQQLKRLKSEPSVDDIDSSEEDHPDDDPEIFPVVRPLPYVRRRPLASDNSSLTPFIEDEDDSTDTEIQRRDHARRSLKTVIYGPGKAEFTEKELLTVFPARSKRRMIADSLIRTPKCARIDYGTMSYNRSSKLTLAPLCRIPKEMIARYINGTHWLSPIPPDIDDIDVFPGTNGFVPGESVIFPKQRFPSSDRETRDGDSGKASSATYVNSGSSTAGSPRAKKLELQNGSIDIELGPPLSTLRSTRVEEANGGRDSEVTHRKNGKVHQPPKSAFKAWKDHAPYGTETGWAKLPTQLHEVKHVSPTNGQGTTGGAGLHVPPLQNVTPVEQQKQPALEKGLNQGKILHATAKQYPPPNTLPQLKNPEEVATGRPAQAKVKPSPPQQTPRTAPQMPRTVPQMPRTVPQMPRTVPQTPRTVPLAPRTNSLPTMAPSPNQMAVIARGSPTMSPAAMHPQMGVQPQMSLQPQPAILTAVPVQIAPHQAGLAGHQALHVQQYPQDPRMFSQWQLQNTAIQQTPGTLQLAPGYVSVNSVVATTAPGPFPVQNRIVPMQPGLSLPTDASVPSAMTIRPDATTIQVNGEAVPSIAEAAQPDTSRPASVAPRRPGNFNSQLQEQYHKHYEEMYSKHYDEHMKTLKKRRVENGAS